MSKHTNFDIKDAAGLHIVHNLRHPTSRLTTQSKQTTMVNAPKKDISPLPAGRNGKSTKWSTQRRHQANAGKIGFEAERVRALGALRSLRSKKKLAAEKRLETHCLSNEEKEKWIEDYVERETAGISKQHFGPGGMAASETPRWQITPRPVSIPRVALHIAPQSPFRRFFSL